MFTFLQPVGPTKQMSRIQRTNLRGVEFLLTYARTSITVVIGAANVYYGLFRVILMPKYE
jgi:hypothetical protein